MKIDQLKKKSTQPVKNLHEKKQDIFNFSFLNSEIKESIYYVKHLKRKMFFKKLFLLLFSFYKI